METEKKIIKDLGDGLIMRRSSPADADALSDFNGHIHAEDGEDFNDTVAQWTRDLLTKPHPTFHPEDFTIVEEKDSGKIVSCMCLIDQTWAYEGIEFGVGQPEIVGTHPDYRRRGLIRKQFEVVHQWSKERGQMVTAITGIPWYYRMFGYEMTMDLETGRRGYVRQIPRLKKGETEKYTLRPAVPGDIPFISKVYSRNIQRYAITCQYDQALWQYQMDTINPDSVAYLINSIIEDRDGHPIGYVMHKHRLYRNLLSVYAYEIQQGSSWVEVTPSVLRYLEKNGKEYARQENQEKENGKDQESEEAVFLGYFFKFGSQHTVYGAVPEYLPDVSSTYSWYLRVPDLIGFLQLITPALEERLAHSYAAGHSGELKLNLYTSGIKMILEKGKIKTVEPWEKPDYTEASAQFPDLTFLQLLFCSRSLDELDASFADLYPNWRHPEGGQLLRALFPKKPSSIWPVS